MRIPSGSTDKYLYFVALDATDLKTRETGLTTWTVARSRNGAADVAWTTPTVTEIDAAAMPGVYALLLDEDTTLGAGVESEEMCVHITHAGMAPVTRTFEIYRPTEQRVLDQSVLCPQEVPPADATLEEALAYLYKAWRNRVEQTSGEYRLYDDAGTTVDQKSSVSDNGTVTTKGEIASGP